MKITKQVARYLIGNAAISFALLALLYISLIFLLPANPKTLQVYDLTPIEYRIIILAIALPSIGVWLAAFLGYSRLRAYAYSIHKTADGHNFKQLARGATWLAWSLPITSIVGLTLTAIGRQVMEFLPTAIIVSNYLNVILPLVAFTIIGSATRSLINEVKLTLSLASVRAITLGFAVVGVLYCYLVFRQLDLSSLATSNNVYYLPVWLLVLTVIIPYLYTWFVGVLAAYEINLFSKNTPGILYRRALRLLAAGFILIIASSIALQYITGFQPRVGYLILNYKLAMMLAFRILEGVGFILLAMGANRLRKIEEV